MYSISRTYFLIVLLIGSFLLSALEAWSAKVIISGKAPGYEQKSIELNTLHDFISEEKVKIGTIRFDGEGTFKLETEISDITLCFADFDGFHGMIYLEPGKTYQIVLPPKQIQTESQKRNPFFKPEPVWFGILNPVKNDINVNIQKYEQAYSVYENQYFDQIFVNHNKPLADTIKLKLNKEFPKTDQPFFEDHKLFRMANLDFALNRGKSAGFMGTYFSNNKPIYNLDAYSTAFSQVFQNYFDMLINGSNGEVVRKMINASNLKNIDDYFQKQFHFCTDLSHWVLLQSLKDGFYSKQFSKVAILKMLDQVKTLGWSKYEQETALLIRTKLTWLASGTIPPTISLTELSGKSIKLSEFSGNYIYLHFTDPANSICRQHLEALKTVAGHYKQNLTIINVIPKGASIKPESGWPGLFVTTDANIDNTFKVKTFPTAYLIAKDGKLLLSPAPNPIDGLDRQLGQIFKSDHFKELQKSGK